METIMGSLLNCPLFLSRESSMSNLIYSILPDPLRSIMQVHPDTDIIQCIELMASHKIGALVVTDDENLLGILSERDIVWGLHKFQNNLTDKKASDLMNANVAVLKPTDTVETAMAIMIETKRR